MWSDLYAPKWNLLDRMYGVPTVKFQQNQLVPENKCVDKHNLSSMYLFTVQKVHTKTEMLVWVIAEVFWFHRYMIFYAV
jgi:hypothetical protein